MTDLINVKKGKENMFDFEAVVSDQILPKTLRVLIYQYLNNASDLLKCQAKSFFFEVCDSVREITADLPADRPLIFAFAAQFSKLEKISGPYDEKEKIQRMGFLDYIAEWTPLIEKGVKFDHVLFFREPREQDTVKVAEGISIRQKNINLNLKEEKAAAPLLQRPPLNFGIYDIQSRKQSYLWWGFFEGGVLPQFADHFDNAKAAGLHKLWIDTTNAYDKDDIRSVWVDALSAGMIIVEFGIPRFNDYLEVYSEEAKQRIRGAHTELKKEYKNAPPLLFQ
jgi:hypothetical protein